MGEVKFFIKLIYLGKLITKIINVIIINLIPKSGIVIII